MDDILRKVTEFAKLAHGDQRRKFVDEPYINHPVRVMKICEDYTDDIAVLAAALLHDVLEDTPVTKDAIQHFLRSVMDEQKAMSALELVEELTDIYTKKDYPQWNRRKRKSKEANRLRKSSSEAQTIKYADIIDNSLDIGNAQSDFAMLFLFECRALLKAMDRGNKDLYKKATETVQQCIEDQKQL